VLEAFKPLTFIILVVSVFAAPTVGVPERGTDLQPLSDVDFAGLIGNLSLCDLGLRRTLLSHLLGRRKVRMNLPRVKGRKELRLDMRRG
jgi:hypothetical protein